MRIDVVHMVVMDDTWVDKTIITTSLLHKLSAKEALVEV